MGKGNDRYFVLFSFVTWRKTEKSTLKRLCERISLEIDSIKPAEGRHCRLVQLQRTNELSWRRIWQKSHVCVRNGGPRNKQEVGRPPVSVAWWTLKAWAKNIKASKDDEETQRP